MLNANDFFKRYLKATDLPKNGITCQITNVYADKVFDRRKNEEVAKAHIDFNEYPGKPMIPNDTQGNVLTDLFGENMGQWLGRWVYLVPEKLPSGILTIRVMAAPQQGQAAAQPPAQPGTAATPPEPAAAPVDVYQAAPLPEEGENELPI